jgi:hypothetical protein
MSILDIEFRWPVASCGYVVREVAAGPDYDRAPLLSSSPSARPGGVYIAARCPSAEMQLKQPLLLNPTLYLQFADLTDQPSAFADFATSWGLLFDGSYSQPDGESVYLWHKHRQILRQALELSERDPRHLLHFQPEGPGTRIEPDLTPTLVWAEGRLALRLTPRGLMHALWLQFFQHMTQGKGEIKSCDRCGAWFERGTGTDRGRKARFCSDACRFGFHNERRSKGASQ